MQTETFLERHSLKHLNGQKYHTETRPGRLDIHVDAPVLPGPVFRPLLPPKPRMNADAPKPKVSLYPRGQIRLNKLANEALKTPERLLLLYTPDGRSVALQAAEADDPRGLLLRNERNSERTICSVTGFFRHLRLALPRTLHIDATLEDGRLLFTLGADVDSR